MSLIKKLFWPKRDYIKIFERFDDEESLNEFFNEVNRNGGRILDIQDRSYAVHHSTSYEEILDGTNEFRQGVDYNVIKRTIVHYCSPKKVDYVLKAERELQEEIKRERRKHESRKNLEAVRKTIKNYSKMQKENSVEEKLKQEDEYNHFAGDLPF